MVRNTENNHDGAYKKIFSHPEMVESLIRDFVPEDWVRELDFSTLKNVNKSFITDEIRSRADDIIWKVRWNDSWVYVYLIIEFQSSVDKWMAVRTMVYTGLLYQDLIASREVGPGELLPPVFPLVLYNGLGAWTARVNYHPNRTTHGHLMEPVDGHLIGPLQSGHFDILKPGHWVGEKSPRRGLAS